MAEKTLNTRIINKHDTSTNWNKAINFVPKSGEIIVYSDLNKIKIGNGVTTVINLPFIGAGDLATVAETGDYEDLENLPTIPSALTDLTGTLPISQGGTGQTTAAGVRNVLGLGNTTGAVPIANGGTGATTVASARNALGLGDTSGALPIANGGTGATTAANARTNLELAAVASSGAYDDLSGKPAIPSALSDLTGVLPISRGGTGADSWSAAREALHFFVGDPPDSPEDGDIWIDVT